MDNEGLDYMETVKTFLIPDDLCRRAGIAASWIKGNELSVFPYQHKPVKAADLPSQFHPCESNIFMLRQEVTLFHPIIKKLVNESNGTYLSLQNLTEKLKYGDSKVEMLKISRQYRAIIRACLENLHEAITASNSEQDKDFLLNYVAIFYNIECIWHLCEIMYVDTMPGDFVTPSLLEWVRLHFPNHEVSATQILEACQSGSETRGDYWETVHGMVMQGRVDIARALLKLHSDSDSNHFKMADIVLRTLPSYDVSSGISINEFTVNWKHWQIDCEAKINTSTFESEPKLDHIMRLVCGQRAALEQSRASCASWRDLLGAWLVYVRVGARRGELGQAARGCAQVRAPHQQHTPQTTHMDVITLAVMEDDMHQVLHEIQQMSDNGWFATHLTDLLVHCGKLNIQDDYQTDVGEQLRNSLVLEYGSLLAGHRSLWAAGFSYLAHGPEEGRHRLALHLASLPLGSEQRVMKMLHEAKKYNLQEVAESICQRQAMTLCMRNRLGGALGWSLRARAAALASRLADQVLRAYASTGKLADDTDLIGTLGPDMMLSDRLVFLAKYCEFHRLYKSSEFKDAGSLLISLLSSKITPNYFWCTLLMDTLPLLECDSVVFSTDATYEIMNCLEERGTGDELGDKMKLLRLGLARNLARTLLLDDEEITQDIE